VPFVLSGEKRIENLRKNFLRYSRALVFDEYLYIGTLVDKAGFKANVLQWDRKKAVHTVYITDPKSYEWNMYTEGWVASAYALYPTSSVIQYDVWYAPGVVGWMYTPETTVADLLKQVGNGDVNAGAQKLGLKYYTGSNLQPILNWTNTQIGPLMYNNKLTYNNKTYSITTENQFWDLYKLGEGMLMMDALRVFTVEQWNFFEVSKSVNVGIADPLTGLASTMAIRSLSKAQPTPTTTSSTSSPSTSSTSSPSPTSTTSPSSTPTTTSPSPTSTPSGGGTSTTTWVIVGLVIIAIIGGAWYYMKK